MAQLREGTEFVSEEQVQDAFDTLHEIATDKMVDATTRIDASRALIDYGGVKPPYYVYAPEPEPDVVDGEVDE